MRKAAWALAAMLVLMPAGYAAGDIQQVQLLIQKLRASMESLKELDELEKAGMSKRDVDRMRNALRQKIQQMIDDTIAEIQKL